jgi:hypothetical protein
MASLCIASHIKIHYKMDFSGCFFLPPFGPPNHAFVYMIIVCLKTVGRITKSLGNLVIGRSLELWSQELMGFNKFTMTYE